MYVMHSIIFSSDESSADFYIFILLQQIIKNILKTETHKQTIEEIKYYNELIQKLNAMLNRMTDIEVKATYALIKGN